MIRNCDGTPYRVAGSLQQFDPQNPEHDLFNLWDEEVIKIGGSPIFYHEVFIDPNTVDPLYRESRSKVYADEGVELYGFYDPIPQQQFQNVFGIDSPDEVQMEFNYRSVLRAIGHPPKIGSRLWTPHKRENWIIVQRNVGEFKLWGELRLVLMCQRFQESATTGEGNVTQKTPDFKLNEGSLIRGR